MKAGFLQFNPVHGQPERNRDHLLSLMEKSALESDLPDILVLPELVFSGYLFPDRKTAIDLAFTLEDSFFDPLQQFCDSKEIALVAGFAESSDHQLYNSAIILTPQKPRGVYRKNHLFDREKLVFEPGNLGFPVFEHQGVKFGVLICFDHMFPEAARALALQGVDLICHPANLVLPGYAQITSVARALENRIFWVLANRYGRERVLSPEPQPELFELSFSGRSRILSPMGAVLIEADAREVSLLSIPIDTAECRDKGLGERNDLLTDRRPALYRELIRPPVEKRAD